MFCVECGKEKPIFKNGVCIDCYLKTHRFTQGPQYIDITVCPQCDSFKVKNTWVPDDFETVLRRCIRDTFRISKELTNVKISLEYTPHSKHNLCTVTISGCVDDHEITENHQVIIRENKTICNICSRRFGGYYEAILQIRRGKQKLLKKEREQLQVTVEHLVEQLRNKGNRGLFITDIGLEHSGIDVYLSEKGAAQTIAKKIHDQYGGEIKQSSKNIGMKDGRQVYRMTYRIRLPTYQKGDFLEHNNSYYYIVAIKANKVHSIELSTWVEKVFDGKDLQKACILGGNELVKNMIFVSQSKDEVQVMDSETYKTVELRKPKHVSFDSKMIQIVKLEERLFLVPEKKSTIDK
jgi:nonsense-mediated mRNA decay protein 3